MAQQPTMTPDAVRLLCMMQPSASYSQSQQQITFTGQQQTSNQVRQQQAAAEPRQSVIQPLTLQPLQPVAKPPANQPKQIFKPQPKAAQSTKSYAKPKKSPVVQPSPRPKSVMVVASTPTTVAIKTESDRKRTLAEFRIEVWRAHNQFRGKHGASALMLNPKLNDLAQDWAQQVAKSGKLEAKKQCQYGQNTYYAKGKGYAGETPVMKWYSSLDKYNFSKPAYSQESGSLTQLLWRHTSRIGVGMVEGQPGELYVVCFYDPAGNILGEFENNVKPFGWKPRPVVGPPSIACHPQVMTLGGKTEYDVETLPFKLEIFRKQVLDSNNDYRKRHGAPSLILSAPLSSYAQEWAERIGRGKQLHHRPNNKYGENLYYCYNKGYNGMEAVKSWYNEIHAFDFARPDFKKGTGHFTQLIWKSSKLLGVGVSRPRSGELFVVANYDPPGNVIGMFKENVQPSAVPVKR